MKLFTIAALLLIVTYAVIFQKEKPQITTKPKQKVSTPQGQSQKIFKAEDITELDWSYEKEKIQVKKHNPHWVKTSPGHFSIDDWDVQRRVVVLSETPLKIGITVTNPIGEVEITLPSKKFHGIYDQTGFLWTEGELKDQGFLFNEHPDIKTLFDEGLWGFRSHTLKICEAKKIDTVEFKDWSLNKENKEWQVFEKNKKTRARPEVVDTLISTLCQITVDSFAEKTTPPATPPIVALKWGRQDVEIKKEKELFYITGFIIGINSHSLAETLRVTTADDIKDPSLEEAKIAGDKSASKDDRIKAIRKLRGNRSPEALAALKSIIFEKTDIDLFRYEAVDSLVAIGTKEAYNVIIERLAQVGRSGFELRLARALAPAIGSYFKSDEKTPESIRRPEVDALIKAAQAHPPGH